MPCLYPKTATANNLDSNTDHLNQYWVIDTEFISVAQHGYEVISNGWITDAVFASPKEDRHLSQQKMANWYFGIWSK